MSKYVPAARVTVRTTYFKRRFLSVLNIRTDYELLFFYLAKDLGCEAKALST